MSVTVVPGSGIKFVPLISTSVPGGAPVGLKEVMVGGGNTTVVVAVAVSFVGILSSKVPGKTVVAVAVMLPFVSGGVTVRTKVRFSPCVRLPK